MLRYKLRTLLIVLALGPPVLAVTPLFLWYTLDTIWSVAATIMRML